MTAEINPIDPVKEEPPSPTVVRHLVLAVMTSSVVVAYLTRSALAPASSMIQAELRLSNTAMGQVLGVWALGYVCFQLPGGWLGGWFGWPGRVGARLRPYGCNSSGTPRGL